MNIMTVNIELGSAEIECECEFDFTPGRPAYISGPPEDCYPEELEEFEPYKLTYLTSNKIEIDISWMIPFFEDEIDVAFDSWKEDQEAEAEYDTISGEHNET